MWASRGSVGGKGVSRDTGVDRHAQSTADILGRCRRLEPRIEQFRLQPDALAEQLRPSVVGRSEAFPDAGARQRMVEAPLGLLAKKFCGRRCWVNSGRKFLSKS